MFVDPTIPLESPTEDFELFLPVDQGNTAVDSHVLDSSWPTSPEELYVQATPHYSPLSTPFTRGEINPYFPTSLQNAGDELFPTVPSTRETMPPPSSPTVTTPTRAQNRAAEQNTTSLPGLRARPARRYSQPAQSEASAQPSSRRMAHNLVERRYRDALNSELERLRRAIPHIRGLDSETPDGRPRPSKATVLAAATDYIKRLERECDALQDELDRRAEEAREMQ